MFERRIFAFLGFAFALVGGLLVLVEALSLGRLRDLNLEVLARSALGVILGIAAILGGLVMSKGHGVLSKVRMRTGGIATVVIGVVLIIVLGGLGGILALVGGILGLVGAEI